MNTKFYFLHAIYKKLNFLTNINVQTTFINFYKLKNAQNFIHFFFSKVWIDNECIFFNIFALS